LISGYILVSWASDPQYIRGMTDHRADVDAITRLKYRYMRLLDTKQWDEFSRCFAADATADYAGLAFDDPAALVDYMRSNLGEGVLTMHTVHHPEIDVVGDTATGTWYLQDKVLVDTTLAARSRGGADRSAGRDDAAAAHGGHQHVRFALEGAAIYDDRYVRTPDGWRIQHTGYQRTFELSWSLDDPAGAKVTGPGTHTHA
jgi:hypothetical protein